MRCLLPLVLLVSTSCGDPSPKGPNDVEVGKVKGGNALPTGKARGPSSELAARWPLGAKPARYAYADVAALSSTELVKGLKGLLALAEVPEGPRKCGAAFFSNAKELLAGESEDNESFVALRVDGNAVQAACAAVVAEGKKEEKVNGATIVKTGSNEVMAFAPGWVFLGGRENVEAALASKGGPLPNIHLAADELAMVHGTKSGDLVFDGTLVMNNEHIKVAVDVSARAEDVQYLESVLVEAKQKSKTVGKEFATTPDERKLLEHLVDSWTFSRDGQKLHVQLDLVEDATAQARDIGLLSTMGIYGVRRYIANAKTAEAKNSLGQISKDLAVWYEGEEMGPSGNVAPRTSKRLFSLPPIPKTVPKGVKYQSSPADWKPWEKLRFELASPQYYQYEVKAAKDGLSADIIARGDLNGDGKTSEFVLHVVIDQDRIEISPSIAEKNPEE